MLSKDKVFLGDPTFIIDGSNRPTKFEYATILCSWSEMFNKRIKELREIAPLNTGCLNYHHLSQSCMKNMKEILINFSNNPKFSKFPIKKRA